MKIKHFALLMAVAAVTGLWAYNARTSSEPRPGTDNIALLNMEALTEDEGPTTEVPDPGTDPIVDPEKGALDREECIRKGGIWNRSPVLVDFGFEKINCEVSGEINIKGFIIKGEYTKGESYGLPWAAYKCEENIGECCEKQGLYTEETKLA